MKYRAIISQAWGLTQSHKKLIWWFAYIPALLTTIVAIVYMGYQALAFWSSPFVRSQAGEESFWWEIFDKGLFLYKNHPGLSVFIITLIAIVGVLYLMLPVFTQGALIQMIVRIRQGENPGIMQGISFGFSRFLQLFEYHAIIKTFSFITVVSMASTVFREFGLSALGFFSWIFLIFLIAGAVMTLLFTYSEYFIVLNKTNVFKGMISSGGLVLTHLHHTLFMLVLMIFITIRIIINILFALLVPAIVVAPIFLFAGSLKLGLITGAIVGSIALFFAAYFLSIFDVFATAVWAFTFLELMEEEGPATMPQN